MPLIEEHRLALAKLEVVRTRDRLVDTVSELADLVAPRRIMTEVWENAKDKGADLAENAVDAVRRRPVIAGSMLAAAVAWFAREPLKDAAASAYDAMTSKSKKSGKKKTVAAKAPVAPAAPKAPARPKPRAAGKRPRPAREASPKTVETKA